mmetsp:Transcript_21093/g.34815  ORF Transcript_21093/g.34815 Transcript_21093/m.34815 type:complete len:303 (-) Transcript_21093:83-991(-)|eukprot:CAMPEP_0119305018 /NCGR_PEP_ID=MMETSP1333-20130426/6106_1 /TAXON_ID=418940 /ORGANISM="Scyphosphaera apsteinii, Strain RCC1455" /LENGTH=302 /DNA_ID=CAMNT_0007308015 /DNA_START=75 /DNA_END=983 /DNA_ORIENTATION=+
MSLSFLGQKSFHPSNPKNLAKLFKAEEEKRRTDEQKEQNARDFAQEEARRQVRGIIKERTGGPAEPPPSMNFMYAAPPGLNEAKQRQQEQEAAEKQPAARDEERFPILKGAPRQGEYTLGIEVTHKPFAVELRKVKCSRCEAWGHQAGDRECPLRNELLPSDDQRKAMLDPVQPRPGSESSGEPLRWELKGMPDSGMRGVGSGTDANQQFVVDDNDLGAAQGNVALAEIDPEVLAALSEKQQKKLLKMYRQEIKALEEGAERDGGHKSKRKRKHDKDKKKGHKKKHKKSARSESSEHSSNSK